MKCPAPKCGAAMQPLAHILAGRVALNTWICTAKTNEGHMCGVTATS